ncbi:hypothetical protein [Mycolicibacterium duvalii]|uniref:FAD-dependent oxidoreductase 2 FAD binding domain-containing protein n=1 Tax=Mycolicibacterium duvalii TaxID=39688 RepID=A0A7I7K0U4_9MYCO|nr:hypothetical protein [Mycolicibacterium duvalii]BBX17673.1 hypothetical protein MDUV_25330 [Mycolicibacterium duvalii]
MCAEMDWDDEVDVVCTGAGIAGLAVAITAIDEGADVLVADPPAAAPDARWWPGDCGDVDTAAYLDELTADFDTTGLGYDQDDLPVRTVLTDTERRNTVPPFIGSRMRDWAARCIGSPSGFLYTRVTEWPTTTVALRGGETWEVADLGAVTPDDGDPVAWLHNWLSDEAQERDVERFPVHCLQRLVLDNGAVSGAVFDTTSGPFSVRARHGVLIGPSTRSSRGRGPAGHPSPDTGLRAALVGKAGSRFGRVELLNFATAAEKR